MLEVLCPCFSVFVAPDCIFTGVWLVNVIGCACLWLSKRPKVPPCPCLPSLCPAQGGVCVCCASDVVFLLLPFFHLLRFGLGKRLCQIVQDFIIDVLQWKGHRQMERDPCFQLTDASCDFKEAILNRIELRVYPPCAL